MQNKIQSDTKVRLNNNIDMPILGFGTWQIDGKDAEKAVLCALEAGYRLIDTAAIYENEEHVGNALRASGIPRADIFVTTKLWNSDHGYDSTINACEISLKKLGLSYVDLYLIHWPVGKLRDETWKAMEVLLKREKCRAIGVSNYMIRHLEGLFNNSSTIPAIDQIEFSPYFYQKDLLDFCFSRGIQLEGYSPLTRGKKLNDPKLVSIAVKYDKNTAQVLIRWALQLGLIVIPKSSHPERIRDNADVFDFEISAEDMAFIASLNEDMRICWDPSTQE
jgi:diketogulonate reductase-like aldo/keto reductase